jgi:type I restriction enzyme S subunit
LINGPVSSTNADPENLLPSKGVEVLMPASGESALDITAAYVVSSQAIALGGDLNVIATELDGYFLAAQLSGKRRKDQQVRQRQYL